MRKSGFSLVEMMMTVSLAGIIGSVAVANMRNRPPEYYLDGAAQKVMTDMRYARMQAVAKNAPVRLTFSSSAGQYAIWTDINGNGAQDSGEVELKNLQKYPGVTCWTYPSSGTFSTKGTFASSSSYCYIGLSSQAGYKIIYIFPSGHVDPYNMLN